MTVVLDNILCSNLIGLRLDWQNFLSVMGMNKQVWNNAVPVATLQLKTLPLMRGITGLDAWRQGEAFGNGNILLELNCQVQLWSFGEGILFRPPLVLPPTLPFSHKCFIYIYILYYTYRKRCLENEMITIFVVSGSGQPQWCAAFSSLSNFPSFCVRYKHMESQREQGWARQNRHWLSFLVDRRVWPSRIWETDLIKEVRNHDHQAWLNRSS